MKTKLFFAAAWLLLSVGARAQTRSIEELLIDAKAGDSWAQLECGINYANGSNGFPQNDSLSVYWLQRTLDNSTVTDDSPGLAAMQLAFYYFDGRYVEKSDEKGFMLIKRAAESGLSGAQYEVGDCYEKGIGTEPDMKQAVFWYQLSADNGDPDAQFVMGKCFMEGLGGCPQDKAEAVRYLLLAAEQGHEWAQYAMGLAYLGDLNVDIEPDLMEAIGWLRKSADQNLSLAQFKLGELYTYGDNVSQDYSKGEYWLQKAAEQGHMDAQYMLGAYYVNGWGVAKNNEIAFEWMVKAADQGNDKAQYWVGFHYYMGKAAGMGNKQQTKELEAIGARYLQLSANQGNAAACYSLAMCYSLGHGVRVNRQTSNKWYARAAQLGHQKAINWCRQYNIRY